MKRIKNSLVFLTLVLAGSATAARAEVAISFSTGHRRSSPHYDVRYRSGPSYYSHSPRYYHARPRYVRPYRMVAVTPVVVPQPYYVQPPPPALSGNYGQDIADFRERLSRLRSVVERQKQTGGITQDAYDRFMNALDRIEHDQRARAYDRGGNLDAGDFAELDRRLDQTAEDIEIALAG